MKRAIAVGLWMVALGACQVAALLEPGSPDVAGVVARLRMPASARN